MLKISTPPQNNLLQHACMKRGHPSIYQDTAGDKIQDAWFLQDNSGNDYDVQIKDSNCVDFDVTLYGDIGDHSEFELDKYEITVSFYYLASTANRTLYQIQAKSWGQLGMYLRIQDSLLKLIIGAEEDVLVGIPTGYHTLTLKTIDNSATIEIILDGVVRTSVTRTALISWGDRTLLGARTDSSGVPSLFYYRDMFYFAIHEIDGSYNRLSTLFETNFPEGSGLTTYNMGADAPSGSDIVWTDVATTDKQWATDNLTRPTNLLDGYWKGAPVLDDFVATQPWTDPTVPNGYTKGGTHDANNFVEEHAKGARFVSDGTNLDFRKNISSLIVTHVIVKVTEITGSLAITNGTITVAYISTVGTHVIEWDRGTFNLVIIKRNSACDVVIAHIQYEDRIKYPYNVGSDKTFVAPKLNSLIPTENTYDRNPMDDAALTAAGILQDEDISYEDIIGDESRFHDQSETERTLSLLSYSDIIEPIAGSAFDYVTLKPYINLGIHTEYRVLNGRITCYVKYNSGTTITLFGIEGNDYWSAGTMRGYCLEVRHATMEFVARYHGLNYTIDVSGTWDDSIINKVVMEFYDGDMYIYCNDVLVDTITATWTVQWSSYGSWLGAAAYSATDIDSVAPNGATAEYTIYSLLYEELDVAAAWVKDLIDIRFSEEKGGVYYNLAAGRPASSDGAIVLNGTTDGDQWLLDNKDYHHNLVYGSKDDGTSIVPGDPANKGLDITGAAIDNQDLVNKYSRIQSYLRK